MICALFICRDCTNVWLANNAKAQRAIRIVCRLGWSNQVEACMARQLHCSDSRFGGQSRVSSEALIYSR